MMLVIEATSDRLTSWLLGSRTAWRRQVKAKRQSDQLLQLISRLLADHGVTPRRLTSIVVVQGAGSFSAARIAVAVANALGFGLNIPMVSVKRNAGEADTALLQRVRTMRLPKAGTGALVMPEYSGVPNITLKKSGKKLISALPGASKLK